MPSVPVEALEWMRTMSEGLHVSVKSCRRTVSGRAASIVGAAVRNATREEPALLLLSGGSSVLDVCAELVRRELPWHALHVGQLDERVVPAAHPERAWPGIESVFLARIPTAVAGRHPMPVDHLDAAHAAGAYDDTLERLTSRTRTVVAVCGLGADGHVASVLPGDETAGSDHRVTTTGPYDELLRVTASMAFLRTIPDIVVVASGRSKAAAMRQLVLSPADIPAGCLPAHTTFVIDREAATLMNQSPRRSQTSKTG